MGFTEVLTIVFIVLKLMGVIGWSWWLILLPEIIGICIYLGLVIFAILANVSTHRAWKQIMKDSKEER